MVIPALIDVSGGQKHCGHCPGEITTACSCGNTITSREAFTPYCSNCGEPWVSVSDVDPEAVKAMEAKREEYRLALREMAGIAGQ